MEVTCHLSQGSATLGVGNDPDVIRPDLHVVEGLGNQGELLGHVDIPRNGLDHGVLNPNLILEQLGSAKMQG